MANRTRSDANKDQPSLQEWVAGGAKNPDDFDDETASDVAEQSGGKDRLASKKAKDPKHQA